MFSRGGSRDALVHSLPMEPSVKEFQDSVRQETPNRFLMIDDFWIKCKSVVCLSKCFCGRLQIVPKAPPVKKSEHSARWGPPNSRGTVHGFPCGKKNFPWSRNPKCRRTVPPGQGVSIKKSMDKQKLGRKFPASEASQKIFGIFPLQNIFFL